MPDHENELRQTLQALISDLDELVANSRGVAGLHLNGDEAPWDELLPGGRHEWLPALGKARALLARSMAELETPEQASYRELDASGVRTGADAAFNAELRCAERVRGPMAKPLASP